MVEAVRNTFEGVLKSRYEPIKSESPFVKMQGIFDADQVILQSVTTVDAGIEDCASFALNKGSRELKKKGFAAGGIAHEVLPLNSHSIIIRTVFSYFGLAAFKPREVLAKQVWKR